FQAEDGIRDDLVTGVQTCALPILLAWWGWFALQGQVATGRLRAACAAAWMVGTVAAILVDWAGGLAAATILVDAIYRWRRGRGRSEERRVGRGVATRVGVAVWQ